MTIELLSCGRLDNIYRPDTVDPEHLKTILDMPKFILTIDEDHLRKKSVIEVTRDDFREYIEDHTLVPLARPDHAFHAVVARLDRKEVIYICKTYPKALEVYVTAWHIESWDFYCIDNDGRLRCYSVMDTINDTYKDSDSHVTYTHMAVWGKRGDMRYTDVNVCCFGTLQEAFEFMVRKIETLPESYNIRVGTMELILARLLHTKICVEYGSIESCHCLRGWVEQHIGVETPMVDVVLQCDDSSQYTPSKMHLRSCIEWIPRLDGGLYSLCFRDVGAFDVFDKYVDAEYATEAYRALAANERSVTHRTV
ncbi:hypothetical protein HDU85_005895 [Gaertneriomyces sp. JEL0708]|nr:hypothetical protein HDU85_005895 [Gaertneriomyces sp. JEL0708]